MRPDPAQRWTLKRVFAFGAACATLVTVGIVALGTAAMLRLTEARVALLDDVGPATVSAQNLLGDLVNQETGVRGFVLGGGNPAFLDPYTQGMAAQQADVAAIRGLVADGGFPRIAADLDAVEAGVETWRRTYAQPVLVRVAAAPDAERGKALFDPVRGSLAGLRDDLDAAGL